MNGMTPLIEKLIRNSRAMIIIWCLVILVVFVKHNFLTSFPNNYLIFKYTYVHAVLGESLYGYHSGEYDDKNHYGPFFSVVIAPFAILPNWAGHLLWVSALVVSLLVAVRMLPLEEWQKNSILLICIHEILTAGFNVQFNIAIAAFLLFTFILIQREKEFWAPIPTLVGTFVKLYGIVGLAFFFCVRNKTKFIMGCLVWALVCFVLPMALSSPGYVINAYAEWYKYLVIKNTENVTLTSWQDISFIGFARRMSGNADLPNLPFLLSGAALFGLPYLRISQYQNRVYQLLLLASTLMFPVLFSSASESSTYIIVFIGIAIWFVIQPRPYSWDVWALLALAILFGSLNTSDIYPKVFRDFLRLYSIKALPCTIIWLRIIYEMTTRDFSKYNVNLALFQNKKPDIAQTQIKET